MRLFGTAGVAALIAVSGICAEAQQTDPFNRSVLPIPPEAFQGVAGLSSKESVAAFPRAP